MTAHRGVESVTKKNYLPASGNVASPEFVERNDEAGVVLPSRENCMPSTVDELAMAEGRVLVGIVTLDR